MKNLSALLLLAVLCSLQLLTCGSQSTMIAKSCCPTYYSKRVPLRTVVSFYRTSSSCAIPAVVFVTEKRKEFCLDPNHAWVNSHVQSLESRNVTPGGNV